ncbi:hypothetical protein OBK16_12030 [Empedobacter falsenii]|uniref:hypothetical protein n=1 Tax=Empedobacter falsenii TaxID=343874 RepID=UPI00056FAD56|nr:hypothetical protein [Empedobacter falsenii]
MKNNSNLYKIPLIFLGIVTLFFSCFKKEKNELTKKERIQKIYKYVSHDIDIDKEKIALLSILKNIPINDATTILKEYKFKKEFINDFNGDYTIQIIDTISRQNNIPKKTIASLIFSFEYEMITKEEIEDLAIENYIEDNKPDD